MRPEEEAMSQTVLSDRRGLRVPADASPTELVDAQLGAAQRQLALARERLIAARRRVVALEEGRIIRDEVSGLYRPDESTSEFAIRLRGEMGIGAEGHPN